MFHGFTLFLKGEFPGEEGHDGGYDGREDGEEKPYHRLDRFFVGDMDHRLTGEHIRVRDESGHTQKECNQAAGDSASEFLRHGSGGDRRWGAARHGAAACTTVRNS